MGLWFVFISKRAFSQLESLLNAYENQLSFDELQTVLNYYDSLKK